MLAEIAELDTTVATARMQEIYKQPIDADLIGQRVGELKDGGIVAAASLTPQRVEQYHDIALVAGLDILVIQGTVVSAEHVSKDETRQPLNLKKFIREFDLPVIVGGCASYSTALHLMRTGAAGCFPFNAPHRLSFYRARNAIYHLFRALLETNPGLTVLAPDYNSGNEILAMRAAGAALVDSARRVDTAMAACRAIAGQDRRVAVTGSLFDLTRLVCDPFSATMAAPLMRRAPRSSGRRRPRSPAASPSGWRSPRRPPARAPSAAGRSA